MMIFKYLKDRLTDAAEFLNVLFFSDFRDFVYSLKNKKLLPYEAELFFSYFTRFSPYFTFMESRGLSYHRNNFFYGEFPYRVLEEIAFILDVNERDVVFDLGCGRGKVLFYLQLLYNVRCCMGYDLISTYVKTSEKIANKLKLDRIFVYEKDISKVDLTAATIVFLHGPTMSKMLHNEIFHNLFCLRPGARFVSVSVVYNHPALDLIEKKSFLLSWGRADVFIYVRNDFSAGEPAGMDGAE